MWTVSEEVLRKAAEDLAAGDPDALAAHYADDAIFEDVPAGETYRGAAAIRGMFETLFSRPGTSFRVAAVRSARGWGVLEWVWSGRTGTSGTPFELRGVSVLEFSGDAVTRERIYYGAAPALR